MRKATLIGIIGTIFFGSIGVFICLLLNEGAYYSYDIRCEPEKGTFDIAVSGGGAKSEQVLTLNEIPNKQGFLDHTCHLKDNLTVRTTINYISTLKERLGQKIYYCAEGIELELTIAHEAEVEVLEKEKQILSFEDFYVNGFDKRFSVDANSKNIRSCLHRKGVNNSWRCNDVNLSEFVANPRAIRPHNSTSGPPSLTMRFCSFLLDIK